MAKKAKRTTKIPKPKTRMPKAPKPKKPKKMSWTP